MITAHTVARLVEDHLQRQIDLDVFGHIDERARIPQGGVERRKLVVVRLDYFGHKVALYQVAVRGDGVAQVGEDHALGRQRCGVGAVDDHAVLKDQAGRGFHLVQLVTDALVDHGVGVALQNHGVKLAQVEAGQPGAPPSLVGVFGPGHRLEGLPGRQPQIEHPCRLLASGG